MLTWGEWRRVEAFWFGTPDGSVPHVSPREWRAACQLFEACLLSEDLLRRVIHVRGF